MQGGNYGVLAYSSALFFDVPVLVFIVLASVFGAAAIARNRRDFIFRLFALLLSLAIVWATIFTLFYVSVGLFLDWVWPSIGDAQVMWLARIPTIALILTFLLRWIIEERRAPEQAPGLVMGKCRTNSRGRFR